MIFQYNGIFINKIFQELIVIFVSEVEQKYTVTYISAFFSSTVEVATCILPLPYVLELNVSQYKFSS